MSGANPKGARATRGQLALVGVLALILVGVIANNFGGGGEDVALAPATPVPVASAGAAPVGDAATAIATKSAEQAGPFGDFAVDKDWPDKPLDKLVEFDPLAPPAWVDAPAEDADAANNTGLEELQQAQNAIIFVTDGVRVARIGEQDYHVGDAIGRFRITDISSAGIVLSDPEGEAGDR